MRTIEWCVFMFGCSKNQKNDTLPSGCNFVNFLNFEIIKEFLIRSRIFNFLFFSKFANLHPLEELIIPLHRGAVNDASCSGLGSERRPVQILFEFFFKKVSIPFFATESFLI